MKREKKVIASTKIFHIAEIETAGNKEIVMRASDFNDLCADINGLQYDLGKNTIWFETELAIGTEIKLSNKNPMTIVDVIDEEK